MQQSTLHFGSELAELLAPIEKQNGQKIKLIIHAGTPKTGTTSLQTYLNKRQRRLRGKGILYPHNLSVADNPTAPKHQWFERNLVSTHVNHLRENFKNIISQVSSDTHTIVLSSEGIYNHWWDFPEASKALLGILSGLFDTELWVWFRDPLAFIESYYKQCVRNPKLAGNPCYGKDLSFAEMLDIEWFSRHLNYQGFVAECQSIFGETKVLAFEYNGDVVQEAITRLGLATPHDNPTPRQNTSLNGTSIALLRHINRTEISAKDKERLMPHLKYINEVFNRYDHGSLIDEKSRNRVLELSRPITF